MSWQTGILTRRKVVFLLQVAFVFVLAGSLIAGFSNIKPGSSWRPSFGSFKSWTDTTSNHRGGKIGESTIRCPDSGGPTLSNSSSAAANGRLRDGNATLLRMAPEYVKAITTPEDTSFDRLSCPALEGTRYKYLQSTAKAGLNDPENWKYFFALDLTECIDILPRLIGSILETINFLGPQSCALSIVEGRSTDGTYEILLSLRQELEKEGIRYYLTNSNINPKVGHRIVALAELRNLALQPLVDNASKLPSSHDTTILFINDVSICTEDILELIHQRQHQKADMVCPMDWVYLGANPTFYDCWIARGMNGDTFFDIPPDGSWDSAWNIFWNNEGARMSLTTGQPFQVFSCWNGAAVFGAKPFLDSGIRFRAELPGECPQGEPKSLCRDFWINGYGKIAVVPTVNIDYSDKGAKKVKAEKGYVSDWMGRGAEEQQIEWQENPPEKVKCMPSYQNQTWLEWDAPKGVKKEKRGSLTPVEMGQRQYERTVDGPPHYRSPGLMR
ncbi:MAG: hypothetical protein Q9170_003945 [Blastenia crenularia]